MTQLQAARRGMMTEAMKIVAADEGVAVETVREAVASGEAVIPLNKHHSNAHPVGVGRMFTTKINANLGRSATRSDQGDELEKLAVALSAGADFVMDLSVGSDDLKSIRQGMIEACNRPLGTVPVYETISRLAGDIPQMDPAFLFDVIRAQAEQGVDFMTLHAG
ncbi:MAG: phosphomethylpyrimidine synthase ThiC, partial [Kiritimatiellae bacterium]|nr:phosphomethylpyrimidine synthase ThiC [Kiritimatiellia bacterium]